MNTVPAHTRPHRNRRRALVGTTLGAALVVAGLVPAHAADSHPPAGEAAVDAAQPSFPGYRVRDILNWSPETDPDAEMLRARIPLQPRIEPFAPTQANPDLTGDAQVLLMQGDYGNSFFGSTPYNDEFSEHTLNFWQYTDIFAPWHGAATRATPSALYDPATSDWRNRGFEFGSVNIPNPAYTNAAHRNGALSIATIYFDPYFRPGVSVDELLLDQREDGSFPVADKLIEMAEYFGYDGYFFNKEEHSPHPDATFKKFMAYLTANRMYTNYYDVNSAIDDDKVAWLKDEEHGQIHDSVFVNYGWPEWAPDATEWDRIRDAYGPELYDEFFLGVEANQGKLGGGHPTTAEFPSIYEPGTKNPRTSVALFTPSDFYQRSLDDDLGADLQKTEPLPLMQTDAYQWMVTERERMFFSGVREDVTRTGAEADYTRPDVGVVDADAWTGVADFTPERSVAGGTEFASWFNTGHGVGWWDDGRHSSAQEWTNISIQSLLPSWQWWFETGSGEASSLHADFDYGTDLARKDTQGAETATPFAPIGAFRGGSSLAIYGGLADDTTMRLFKTDLAVEPGTEVDVTYAVPSGAGVGVQLAVVYADQPDTVVNYPLSHSGTDWATETVDLGEQSGRHIATLGLTLAGQSDGVQVNLGGIQVGADESAPAAPSALSIDALYASGDAVLSWDLQSFDEVDSYEVYATRGDGERVWLGGTYDGTLHVQNLDMEPGRGDLAIEVVAVGKDGARSEPATQLIGLDKSVSAVSVEETTDARGFRTQAAEAGSVQVSWQAPASPARVGGYLVELTAQDVAGAEKIEVRVGADARTAVVPVADPEGRRYDVSVVPLNPAGKPRGVMPVSYRGNTHDSLAASYLPADVVSDADGWRLTPPSTWDWHTLTVAYDGVEQFTATRGATDANRELLITRPYPDAEKISIVVTDYAGNTSEPLVLDTADLRQ